ncbi:sigma-54 dependent transcriptional regulator [Candidatus Accumulibacter vicinus]|uniref:Alginate biosynthesis transcriptional regulatory protein AlgB n=1 Tax=Candidatus Accumulibacter vicinus TaxID=2954382 RepID=A0A084XZD4_9PROT|nr:sigma-54 dependent transcriptional regulator [Candidatus Accumulibacter vicinus]KFB67828.1 MAG: Alginate biosynthesis transcriptional regulatory protein AlgB [Candidatus Accumulibacter vicinus]
MMFEDRYAAPIFVGESPAFRQVLSFIAKLARCDAPVLIEGETGTGKELAARAIHYSGARGSAPFVPINCGAIPDNLVESELFGHVRGAFTDAREARSGVVAQAEGGTLFLDEIEALGAHAQVALLRFLQDLEYRPVGGSVSRRANVRVLAASNTDLAALTRQGGYRQDLLFRLKVLVLDMPPLRVRGDDALLLAEAFVARYCSRYGLPAIPINPHSLAHLRGYDWPGNVRELENMVHRELLLNEGETLSLNIPSVPPLCGTTAAPVTEPVQVTDFRQAKAEAIARFERSYLSHLLATTAGNISLAARLCGQDRSRLNKLVRKYGLARSSFTEDATAQWAKNALEST